jgi:hypothetical protein
VQNSEQKIALENPKNKLQNSKITLKKPKNAPKNLKKTLFSSVFLEF